MAKQPKQILEEQLVAQLQMLGYGLIDTIHYKALIISIIGKLNLKMFTEFKKGITFVLTVLATLKSERIAYQGESFAFTGYHNLTNTPPMPLSNAHLGGLFFYTPFWNYDLR
jgi:hypothetical protein